MYTSERIERLTDEYRSMVAQLQNRDDESKLRRLLMNHGDWTILGSEAVVSLAKKYGSFILSNALALAEAMEIEDGDAGL